MYVINAKTIVAGTDQDLEEKLRKLEEQNYKLEHITFIGYNSNNERLWTVVYRKKD